MSENNPPDSDKILQTVTTILRTRMSRSTSARRLRCAGPFRTGLIGAWTGLSGRVHTERPAARHLYHNRPLRRHVPKIQADLRRILSTVQIGFALLDPRQGLTEKEVAQLDRPDQSGTPAPELDVDFELAWKEDPRDGVTPWAFIVDPITRTITGRAARHHYHTLTGGAVRCRIWVSGGQVGLQASGYADAVAPPNYSANRTARDVYVDGRARESRYTIQGRVRSA